MNEADAVELIIAPPPRDLGDGFVVHRALPAPRRRALGPFVFFDRMGLATFAPERGVDVRPHPHIGLATVTYLFEGQILHRDSLGNSQVIRPGAVNWMIAGRGIVHSERTPPTARATGSTLSGLQLWVALPREHEEMPPAFSHQDCEQLPLLEQGGMRARLIAGTFAGARSPVPTLSPMFYLDVQLEPAAILTLDAEHAERGFYISQGTLEVGGQTFEAGPLVVLRPGGKAQLTAGADGARVMALGGAPLEEPRIVWWNFVSSSRERMQRAADDWRAGRFPPVPEEHEFIPLPETAIPALPAAGTVDYP